MIAPIPLRTIAWTFFRLGCTAFGGPAAHVAMMEEEFVRRRAWLTKEEFLDLLGAVNLIPGPNSTEMAIHVGKRVGGWPGFLLAGVCFIMPAAVLVGCLAWAYREFGKLPAMVELFRGVQPVVIAIIVQAILSLSRSALRSPLAIVVAGLAIALAFFGVHEVLILLAGALLMLLGKRQPRTMTCVCPLAIAPLWAAIPGISLSSLFWTFFKIGAILFGSGYVLVAYLRTDVVERQQWITETELLDAVAVGQVTPGPVLTTATFIGYLIDGPQGAAVATLAIFLPAFMLVAISSPFIPRLRRSKFMSACLDGVNAASLALMAFAVIQIARTSLRDVSSAVFAAVCVAVLLRWKVNSTWLIAAGLIFGVVRWQAGL